ncbi:hypothetical protein ACP4OV_007394 [Aristida adscensionis]
MSSMPTKRRGQDDGQNQLGGCKRSRRHRKHLYLVLDDRYNAFSIHKIDVNAFAPVPDDQQDLPVGLAAVTGNLPEPPVLRLESPAGRMNHRHAFFSAMGGKIFALMNQRSALVYDTATGVLALGPQAPPRMVCGFGVTVAVGEALYALSYRAFDQEKKEHSFEVMSWAPTAPDARQHPTKGWSWKTLPLPPPAPPSFTSDHKVVSYALHPDGSSIFMTTASRYAPGIPVGTYSFNTRDHVWKWQGSWALPFHGRGYFDGDLDAWVGLHRDGYVCACKVASRCSNSTTPLLQLDWQMTKEKLFHKDLDKHLHASLTYMGRGRFCVLESESMEQEGLEAEHRGCYMLRLTIFGLKYNHKGELQTANHKTTRSYLVHSYNSNFNPTAFWM